MEAVGACKGTLENWNYAKASFLKKDQPMPSKGRILLESTLWLWKYIKGCKYT